MKLTDDYDLDLKPEQIVKIGIIIAILLFAYAIYEIGYKVAAQKIKKNYDYYINQSCICVELEKKIIKNRLLAPSSKETNQSEQ